MLDTAPRARNRYAEHLRARTPDERLAIALSPTRAVRELAEAGIRQRFPEASADEVRARLAVRLYGRAVGERLFPGLPDNAR